MTAEFRRADEKDIDAILRIENSWSTTPHWTREQFLSDMRSQRHYVCVCVEGGELSGYGVLQFLPPEAELTTIAVAPKQARKGLGRALLAHLHELAAQAQCATLQLEVSETNAAALALYARLGYEKTGRRPGYYKDGSAAVLMKRSI